MGTVHARINSWQAARRATVRAGVSSVLLPLIQHSVLFQVTLETEQTGDYCSTWRLSVLPPDASKLFVSSNTNSMHVHDRHIREREQVTYMISGFQKLWCFVVYIKSSKLCDLKHVGCEISICSTSAPASLMCSKGNESVHYRETGKWTKSEPFKVTPVSCSHVFLLLSSLRAEVFVLHSNSSLPFHSSRVLSLLSSVWS